ncbi:glycosyl hydrolase catalytic core-domain-containing protein [Phaeosphaeriaceae sp. PMI808]|nr:glycosyl hydrolase catalytic core-domain-containing protein [Phaeosphaeriaceae sp. PMI808]
MASVLLYVLIELSLSIHARTIESPTVGGKRGLAFGKGADNPVNLGKPGALYTHYFKGYSQITWMYDWEGIIDGQAIDLEYVPMLHDDRPVFTNAWADAVARAKQSHYTKYILSFNEPDHCEEGGTCMDTDRAVHAHRKHIQPLATQNLKIGSPAVTSAKGPGKGVSWLKEFLAKCNDCQIDFVVAHWYAWDKLEDFKDYMQVMHATFCMPIWVTEFGVNQGDTDAFLHWIQRYAYYMAAPSTQNSKFLIDAAGTGLSSTGHIYATI